MFGRDSKVLEHVAFLWYWYVLFVLFVFAKVNNQHPGLPPLKNEIYPEDIHGYKNRISF